MIPTRGLLAVLMLGGVPTLSTQPRAVGWEVAQLPQVDLWFHGLATVGYGADGGPLYDRGYVVRMQRARAGAPPTALQNDAVALRRAFRTDRAFQLLHFLPLYYAHADRRSMLAALDALARGVRDTDPRTRDATVAIGAALPRADQHQVLGRFVTLLASEWRDVLGPALAADTTGRRRAETAGARWTGTLAPALSPFLARRGIGTGVLALSPALGPEGRVALAPRGASHGAVVVVRAPRDDSPAELAAPAFLVVRELCFPVAREVLAASPSDIANDRGAAADEPRARALAARCGSLVLARHAPSLRAAYESTLVREFARADTRTADARTAFTRTFAVDDRLERLMRQILLQDCLPRDCPSAAPPPPPPPLPH